jgi:hypothetical protein
MVVAAAGCSDSVDPTPDSGPAAVSTVAPTTTAAEQVELDDELFDVVDELDRLEADLDDLDVLEELVEQDVGG